MNISITILNSKTEKSILLLLMNPIRSFLQDLTCDYPFFREWLNNVLSELNTGSRQMVIMTDESNPQQIVGLTILKTEPCEKKICTIRVDKNYLHRGYGTELVRKSLDILKADYPLVTVSEKHMDVFKPFFRQFGFRVVSKVKSLYHDGENEYFFNVPYVHRNVLMSVNPKYADSILNDEKKVEFRKVCFIDTVERVYVYATTPVKQILGYFAIDKIVKDTPERLWKLYGSIGSIKQEDYFSYYDNADTGYAILIKDHHRFQKVLTIPDVFSANYTVPQNYRYIDNVSALHKLKTQQ